MDDIVVEVYDEHIRINLKTGEGFDKVLIKMEPLINSYSYKFKIENLEPEDIKQEISIIILEGIANYNHSKNVKLSTFLHTHIFNKMISKINSSLKKSNNASYLKTQDAFYRAINIDDLGDNPDNFISEENIFSNSDVSSDFNFLVSELKNIFDDLTWDVFDLIFIKGTTIKECAEKLNIETWIVSNRIKKIKENEKIRQFYKRN